MKPSILVCGDVMLDRYIRGHSERLSPEAPVPVISMLKTSHSLGGAANVANNVAHLGATCHLVGMVGDDEDGRLLEEKLAAHSIVSHAVIDGTRPTTTKTRIIAQGRQIARLDSEKTTAACDEVFDALLGAVSKASKDAAICVISDYSKGVVSPTFARTVIELCRSLGVPVLVDPKGNECGQYRGATLVKPNRREAGLLVGRTLDNRHDILDAGRELLDRLGGAEVLVTLGEEGMVLFRQNRGPQFFAGEAREVFDVTGAGDTVLAALAVFLARGHDTVGAVRLANIAAGLVVAKMGTSVVTAEEMEQAAKSTNFAYV